MHICLVPSYAPKTKPPVDTFLITFSMSFTPPAVHETSKVGATPNPDTTIDDPDVKTVIVPIARENTVLFLYPIKALKPNL